MLVHLLVAACAADRRTFLAPWVREPSRGPAPAVASQSAFAAQRQPEAGAPEGWLSERPAPTSSRQTPGRPPSLPKEKGSLAGVLRGALLRRALWAIYSPQPLAEVVRPVLRWLAARGSRAQLEAFRQAFEVLAELAELRERVRGFSAWLQPRARAFVAESLQAAEQKLQEALLVLLEASSPEGTEVRLRDFSRGLSRGLTSASSPFQEAMREARKLLDEVIVIVERAQTEYGPSRLLPWWQSLWEKEPSVPAKEADEPRPRLKHWSRAAASKILWSAYGPLPVAEVLRPTFRWLARRASRRQLEALRDAFAVLTSIARTREEVAAVHGRQSRVDLSYLDDADTKLTLALGIVLDGISPEARNEGVTLRAAAATLQKDPELPPPDGALQAAVREAWRSVNEASAALERARAEGAAQRAADWIQRAAEQRSFVDFVEGDAVLQLQQPPPSHLTRSAVLAYFALGIACFLLNMLFTGRI